MISVESRGTSFGSGRGNLSSDESSFTGDPSAAGVGEEEAGRCGRKRDQTAKAGCPKDYEGKRRRADQRGAGEIVEQREGGRCERAYGEAQCQRYPGATASSQASELETQLTSSFLSSFTSFAVSLFSSLGEAGAMLCNPVSNDQCVKVGVVV